MIEQAISKIEKLASTSKGPIVLTLGDVNRVFLMTPDKEGGWKSEEIKERKKITVPMYDMATVNSAAEIVSKLVADEKADVVWFVDVPDQITAIIDAKDKKSAVAKVELAATEAYKYLLEPRWMTHPEFVRFLRVSFPRAPTAFASAIKSLKIEKRDEIDSTVGQHNASVGKRFEAKAASGGAEIPESVDIAFRAIENLSEPRENSVRCIFEINFQTGTVRLVPVDGGLQGVRDNIFEAIAAEIGEGWTVLNGAAEVIGEIEYFEDEIEIETERT